MAKRGWPAATSLATADGRFARATLAALLRHELLLELEFFLADAVRLFRGSCTLQIVSIAISPASPPSEWASQAGPTRRGGTPIGEILRVMRTSRATKSLRTSSEARPMR